MHRTWHGSGSVGQNFSQVGTRASEVPSLESLPERAFAGKAILPLLARQPEKRRQNLVLRSLIEVSAKTADSVKRRLDFHLAHAVGGKSRFNIHPGYVHRSHTAYFDDTENTDTWQREVYETARHLTAAENLRTVYDVGCG